MLTPRQEPSASAGAPRREGRVRWPPARRRWPLDWTLRAEGSLAGVEQLEGQYVLKACSHGKDGVRK